MPTSARADVYSAREVACAAGVDVEAVARAVARGRGQAGPGGFFTYDEAIRLVAALREDLIQEVVPAVPAGLFAAVRPARRETRVPLAASTGFHGVVLAAVALWPLFGLAITTEVPIEKGPEVRLVFLAQPGPGGGGGGGGLRQPKPPARIARKGESRMSSPIPPPKPVPEVTPKVDPPEPPPPDPEPPVQAPVASRPADPETKSGVPEDKKADDSNGPGAKGGSGTGEGTGIGQGRGPGIGEGSGGGTGGGPYRPGSGIEPPRLVREVKPDYTEEARRRSIEGEVVLEIVVRRDGSVSDVRVIRGLGSGLDQRAAQTVAQWQFAPARRFGTPVDVVVEVSVEFKLR
jgi:TonB family protein